VIKLIENNKINIPWYRANVEQISDLGINTPNNNFNNGSIRSRPRPKALDPKPETVNVPVKIPSTVPVNIPATSPITNPLDSPFPFPVPIPFPAFRPNTNKPFNPLPNVFNPNPFKPIPQPVVQLKIDDTKWKSNFIKQIELTAKVSGINASKVYDFISNYDYENLTVSKFRNDAKDEFGLVGATILTVLIVGKSLFGLWGKRVTTMFSPPINTNDEYFKKYFGNKKETY
jgi:hypothetical protein